MAATWYFFAIGKRAIEGGAGAAGHVLGAEERAVVGFELVDAGFEDLGPAVVVEGDDVGLGELDLGGGAFLLGVRPVAVPDTAGERLRGVGVTGPGEGFGEELVDALYFSGFIGGDVAALVVWLVPDVPAQDAVVRWRRRRRRR